MSTARITRLSTRPPASAAAPPIKLPITSDSATTEIDTASDSRAPHITRASTSARARRIRTDAPARPRERVREIDRERIRAHDQRPGERA